MEAHKWIASLVISVQNTPLSKTNSKRVVKCVWWNELRMQWRVQDPSVKLLTVYVMVDAVATVAVL